MSALPPAPPQADIVSKRAFDAPREAVFDAFRDPGRLATWWGPKGFANVFHEFDLRPGGRWRLDMVGPDGVRYPMEKTFTEVAPPGRVALRHEQAGHGFEMTMTFREVDGKTLLTWRMRFDDPDEAERVRPFVLAANEENLDRLEAHLRR